MRDSLESLMTTAQRERAERRFMVLTGMIAALLTILEQLR